MEFREIEDARRAGEVNVAAKHQPQDLGREIDGGGWFCAEDGVAYATFTTNIDDPAGAYRIVCRDRASGFAAEKTIGGGDKE